VVTPAISSLQEDVPYIERMTGQLFPLAPQLTSTIVGLARYIIDPSNEDEFIGNFIKAGTAEAIRTITDIAQLNAHDEVEILRGLEKLKEINEQIDWEVIVRTVQYCFELQRMCGHLVYG